MMKKANMRKSSKKFNLDTELNEAEFSARILESVFVLRMKYSSKKIKYPVNLNCETLGYFSDVRKAEYFISFPIKESYWFLQDLPFKIFEIQQYGLNYFYMDDYIRIYDRKGKFYGEQESESWQEAFPGRERKDCKFKPGELVEYIQGAILNVGIVAELPADKKRVKEILKRANNVSGIKTHPLTGFSDDRYQVLTGGKSGHAHPQVFNVFQPSGTIPKKLEKHLRASYVARRAARSED